MRVIVKEPNKPCEIRKVKDSLDTYQEIVGGLIESVIIQGLSEHGIICYCNEEGKFKDFDINFLLTWENEIYDIIVGPVVFLRDDGEGGNKSLTDKDIKLIKDYLTTPRLVQ